MYLEHVVGVATIHSEWGQGQCGGGGSGGPINEVWGYTFVTGPLVMGGSRVVAAADQACQGQSFCDVQNKISSQV